MADPQTLEIRPQPGPQVMALQSDADILIYGGQAGGGKRLRIDEPIATPNGWTTMGEICVGDTVFDADGMPTKVLFVSPIVTPLRAIRLTFDDGQSIECDPDHQWVTLSYADRDRLMRSSPEWMESRRAKRKSRSNGKRSKAFVEAVSKANLAKGGVKAAIPNRRGSTRTTQEIVDTLLVKSTRVNHSIVCANPIKHDSECLLIPPYTLGAWLGDGTSCCGGFTGKDPEILDRIRADGFKVTTSEKCDQVHWIHGLVGKLRIAGVLRNKHIPQQYLRGSVADRIELLKGLCDTDGTATDKGSIEFTTTSEPLKNGFVELLASLGIKPSCREGIAKLNGREISKKWRIQFWTELPAFHLNRKLNKQKRTGFRGTHSQRYIVSAEDCEPTPMRCITVDSPTSTYLASRLMIPTHNTWLLVGELTRRIDNPEFRAVIFRRTSPQIMGGGGIWDEANKLYRPLGARMREGQSLDATFPSGAVVEFCHLQLEKNKFDHQGKQYAAIGFDEVTHFTETQFFYLVSRARSSSGIKPYIRATCNPDAGSWVAVFIDWWIDQETGLPIPERSGVLRYFYREDNDGDDKIFWADSKEEIIALKPHLEPDDIMSVTFVPATLADNKILLQKDPSYKSKLLSMPRVERERLLGGNWKIQEGAIIDADWIKRFTIVDNHSYRFLYTGLSFDVPINKCKRIATIDTAGSSKEKAAARRGDPPSWSVCSVWDSLPYYQASYDGSKVILLELLFLRYVWRAQVEWNDLKAIVPNVLQTWNVSRAYIENAQTGPALKSEIKGIQVEMVGPTISGMRDSSNGAKYERAVASGMLTRVEQGKIFVPFEYEPWIPPWIREMTVWTGLPKEVADQIDTASYACHVSKKDSASWGGVINLPNRGQR